MAKVVIHLRDQEMIALNDLAQNEYRPVKAQAALIIRKELERLGMITVPPTDDLESKHGVTRKKAAGKPGGAA